MLPRRTILASTPQIVEEEAWIRRQSYQSIGIRIGPLDIDLRTWESELFPQPAWLSPWGAQGVWQATKIDSVHWHGATSMRSASVDRLPSKAPTRHGPMRYSSDE